MSTNRDVSRPAEAEGSPRAGIAQGGTGSHPGTVAGLSGGDSLPSDAAGGRAEAEATDSDLNG